MQLNVAGPPLGLSSILSAIALATAEGLATEDRRARGRAPSHMGKTQPSPEASSFAEATEGETAGKMPMPLAPPSTGRCASWKRPHLSRLRHRSPPATLRAIYAHAQTDRH